MTAPSRNTPADLRAVARSPLVDPAVSVALLAIADGADQSTERRRKRSRVPTVTETSKRSRP